MTELHKTHDREMALALMAAAASGESARGLRGTEVGGLILQLWQRIRMDWSFATDHLSAAFRKQRQLSSSDRRHVAETLYGMIRHLRRIDEALRLGGHIGGTRAADQLRLVAYWVLEVGVSADDATRFAPNIDWNKVAAVDSVLGRERDAARRIGLTCSLPDWLAEQLVRDLGAEDAEAFAQSLNQRAPMTLRANRLVNDASQLAARLADESIETEAGRYVADALTVISRTNIFGLGAFKAGCFESQDEGSQLIADLVAPPPKALVVDYCAGAGGKTLALAAALGNRGRVVACDISKRKLDELKRRARRAKVTNVQSILLDNEGRAKPLERLARAAARVLVDAPCTGVGALRRNPEARWRLTPDDLQRLPRTQLTIAERALELVAPGGRLIYATCTVLRAENQSVVERLMAAHSDLELVTAREIWGAERAAGIAGKDGVFMELSPQCHGTDGFFAAVLRRKKS